MDLQNGDERCIEVIRFRFLGIKDFDGISLRDTEDWTAKKVFGKLFGIECR